MRVGIYAAACATISAALSAAPAMRLQTQDRVKGQRPAVSSATAIAIYPFPGWSELDLEADGASSRPEADVLSAEDSVNAGLEARP